jgi:hypothetical protein
MYLASQKGVEECIKFSHKRGIKVYNCSDGASIKNTHWISSNKFEDLINNINMNYTISNLNEETYNLCKPISSKKIDEKSALLLECMTSIFDTINKRKSVNKNFFSASKSIFRINDIISRHAKQKFGYIHYFIRGQIWLYLSIYFDYLIKSKTDSDRRNTIEICEEWLEEHQKILINEMKDILFHQLSLDDDQWVNETVESEELTNSTSN